MKLALRFSCAFVYKTATNRNVDNFSETISIVTATIKGAAINYQCKLSAEMDIIYSEFSGFLLEDENQ
jgi:hypothetical protein